MLLSIVLPGKIKQEEIYRKRLVYVVGSARLTRSKIKTALYTVFPRIGYSTSWLVPLSCVSFKRDGEYRNSCI